MRIAIDPAEVTDGEPKQICIPGRGPIAVYMVDGAYFATDDTCTHGDASLADGLQEGFVIECPFHSGTFDIRTGKALTSPVSEDVRAYEVTQEGGKLIVHLETAIIPAASGRAGR
jgi:nitrite reductase/ring-hydroxylating ferredoxin subunit